MELDNLTHGLVGAAISKLGAERITPLATTTLVIAANAPDIDVLSFLRGEYFALSFRRGITHGWPALIVIPFVVTGVILAWDRTVRRRRSPDVNPVRSGPTLLLSFLGVSTHPFLDWLNTYGMRWQLPFADRWTYGDALFIIDPWVWLVLGGAVFLSSSPGRLGNTAWALLAGLLSFAFLVIPIPLAAKATWTIGILIVLWIRFRGHTSFLETPSMIPKGALTAMAAYFVLMVSANLASRRHVRTTAAEANLKVVDVMVSPQPANPFAGEVVVLTDVGFVPGTHHWLRNPRVELFPDQIVPLVNEVAEAERLEVIVEAARRYPDASHYLVWSRYPYVRIEPDGANWWVFFSDARYDRDNGVGGLSGLRIRITEEQLR